MPTFTHLINFTDTDHVQRARSAQRCNSYFSDKASVGKIVFFNQVRGHHGA